MKGSLWAFFLLVIAAVLIAYVAYAHMHPASLPNFHW